MYHSFQTMYHFARPCTTYNRLCTFYTRLIKSIPDNLYSIPKYLEYKPDSVQSIQDYYSLYQIIIYTRLSKSIPDYYNLYSTITIYTRLCTLYGKLCFFIPNFVPSILEFSLLFCTLAIPASS